VRSAAIGLHGEFSSEDQSLTFLMLLLSFVFDKLKHTANAFVAGSERMSDMLLCVNESEGTARLLST